MKGQLLETVTGLLVLMMAGWFVYTVVVGSDQMASGDNVTEYRAVFHDISGVGVGSDVRLAGVNVGKVLAVSLNSHSYLAEIVVTVASDLNIPDDSEILISSEGILGSYFVSITPGGSESFLKPNDTFTYTQSSVNLNNLINKFFGK